MNRTFASFAPHTLFCSTHSVLLHTPCFAPHALFLPIRPVFAPYALKGQKLLAQGIALGYYGR